MNDNPAKITAPPPRDDGGPAYPKSGRYTDAQGAEYDNLPTEGMSLRDHFAGQALMGLLAGGFADTVPHEDAGNDAAFFAYKFADAMIRARSKRGKFK